MDGTLHNEPECKHALWLGLGNNISQRKIILQNTALASIIDENGQKGDASLFYEV